MNELLNETQMKFVRFTRIAIIVLALCFLGISVWLVVIAKDFQDKSIMFPLILGICFLINVYKFNETFKINNGKISPFQVKRHLLMLGRAALISLTYLFIVMHDTKQAIGFGIITLFVIGVEVLICRIEAKKLKKP